MNIEEYISSGILESYVLGITSEQENMEIEGLAVQYSEIKSEIKSIEQALNTYSLKYSATPPAYMKDKIVSTIETLEETKHRRDDEKMVNIKSQKSFDYKVLLIAASVLLLITASFYINRLSEKMNSLKDIVASLAVANDSLSQTLYAQHSKQQQTEKSLALLKNPMNKMVELKGLPKKPDSKAMIIWNTASKEVYVEIENLPPPPDNMQYQLWALMDGKPIDAGMIELPKDSSEMIKMKSIEQAQAFAITLEKKGGNPSPQGEMYVMGSI